MDVVEQAPPAAALDPALAAWLWDTTEAWTRFPEVSAALHDSSTTIRHLTAPAAPHKSPPRPTAFHQQTEPLDLRSAEGWGSWTLRQLHLR